MSEENKTQENLLKELELLRKRVSELEELDAEHSRLEKMFQESEEKYRSLVTNISDVTWTTDFKGKIIYVSSNIEREYGYTSEEIDKGGESVWLGRIHPEDVGKIENNFKKLFEEGIMFDVEYRIKRKDGKWIWLHDRSITVYERDGVMYADGIFSNITERKETEKNIKTQARLLDSIFEYSLDSVVIFDKDYNFIRVSEAYAKVCQKNSYEFPGHNIFEFYPSDFKDKVYEAKKGKYIYRKSAWPFISPNHPEWGTTYWDLGLVPIIDEEGKIELFLFTLKDVTEFKQAKEHLHMFKTFTETSSQGMGWANIEGNIVYVNPAMTEMFEEKDHNFLVGENVITSYYPEDVQKRLREEIFPLILKGESWSGELMLRQTSGKLIPTYNNIFLIRNKVSEPMFIANIVTDITEYKEAEKKLNQAHMNIKIILEKMQVGVVVIGHDKKIIWANNRVRKMAGVESIDILIGKSCGKYLCPAAQDKCPILDLNKKIDNSERIFRRDDGKEISIIKTVNKINFDNEDVLLETFIDITERKKVELELRKNLEDLKQFKQVTVDRENRMIELKKQVNKLCEDIGKPSKYDLSFLNE